MAILNQAPAGATVTQVGPAPTASTPTSLPVAEGPIPSALPVADPAAIPSALPVADTNILPEYVDEARPEDTAAKAVSDASFLELEYDKQTRNFSKEEVSKLVTHGLNIGKITKVQGEMKHKAESFEQRNTVERARSEEMAQFAQLAIQQMLPQIDYSSDDWIKASPARRAAINAAQAKQNDLHAKLVEVYNKVPAEAKSEVTAESVNKHFQDFMMDERFMNYADPAQITADLVSVENMLQSEYGADPKDIMSFISPSTPMSIQKALIDFVRYRASNIAPVANNPINTTPLQQPNKAPATSNPNKPAKDQAEYEARYKVAQSRGLSGASAAAFANGMLRS